MRHPAPVSTPSVPVPAVTWRGLNDIVGLPQPLYRQDAAQSPTQANRSWDQKIGVLTHAVAGRLAPDAQIESPVQLRSRIGEVVAATVTDRSLGRLDRARLRVTGLAAQYLNSFVPPSPAVFVGREVAAGGGRVDLAWDDPTVGVFFDELKTWRHVQAALDEDTWKQVHRYLTSGLAAHGDRFAGVRLITLGHLESCVWISGAGLVELLTGSPLHPNAIAARGVA